MIIISKCPYRISLLGGSTDLEWFTNENKRGFCIGFTINYFSRVIVTYRSESFIRGLLNYSSREEYKNIDGISHPIIRSTLKRFSIKKPIELCSFGDTIGGSGLGSSSAFTAALIKGINKLNNKIIPNKEVAHIASEIEINDLNNPIGRQDQYLCALGGINFLEFQNPSRVNQVFYPELVKPLENFIKKLYIVNTKITRSANENLQNIKDEKSSFNQIKNILTITDNFINQSKGLNNKEVENLLNYSMIKAWDIKKKMIGVLNEDLMNIEQKLKNNGFTVLKLLGAGGGGYFLVKYEDEDNQFNNSLSNLKRFGLDIKEVNISKEGCTAWEC